MKYVNLNDLLRNSHSAREYFYSLPAKKQIILTKEYNGYIHSGADLYSVATSVDTFYRQITLNDSICYINNRYN